MENRFSVVIIKVRPDLTTIEQSRLIQFYRLRYIVYAEENKWILQNPLRQDYDEFDSNSVSFHIGIIDNLTNKPVAYQRLIIRPNLFMCDHTFGPSLCQGIKIIKTPAAAEVSRLTVLEQFRGLSLSNPLRFRGHTINSLLYRGIYRLCLEEDIQFIYTATYKKITDIARSEGIPLKVLNTIILPHDPEPFDLCCLNWRKFEQINKEKCIERLIWFQTYYANAA